MKMKKTFLIIFFGISILLPLISLADGLVPCGRTDPAATAEERKPCQFCHIFILFQNILDFFLFPPPTGGGIVLILATLMIAVAGMYFIFAGGSPGNIAKAKEILTGTAIALLIIYGAWLLINLFFLVIGVADWTKLSPDVRGWFIIECR